tara:strand:+ start:1820 stop:2752 length:933 start_codon:yes stop_codon:yes gene_type:complete
MANIFLRSPYFVTITTASHLSAQIALTIDGTLRYTILKNATSNRTVFEIATLAKDYWSPSATVFDSVAISYVVTTYTAVDGGGTATAQGAVTHTGFYGYGLFTESTNPDIDATDFELTNTADTRVLYLPDNTASFAWDMNSGTATKTTISTSDTSKAAASGNYTWNITRICSAKYTPIKMTFINKNGVAQEHYFFLKSVESINTKSDNYKQSLFRQSTSLYSRTQHQKQIFNKNGNIKYTLNTNYMIEAYNEVMQDILLSEYCWIDFGGVTYRPVVVTSSSLTYKTSLNDRLIQYTLEVEEANSVINNIL